LRASVKVDLLADGETANVGGFTFGEVVQKSIHELQTRVVEKSVVHRVRPPRRDLTHIVDQLGRLEPRSVRREQEGIDFGLGYRVRVPWVEYGSVDEKPHVRNSWPGGVDDGVKLTAHENLEPRRIEGRTLPDRADLDSDPIEVFPGNVVQTSSPGRFSASAASCSPWT